LSEICRRLSKNCKFVSQYLTPKLRRTKATTVTKLCAAAAAAIDVDDDDDDDDDDAKISLLLFSRQPNTHGLDKCD